MCEEIINGPTDGLRTVILVFFICPSATIGAVTRITFVNRGWKDRKRKIQKNVHETLRINKGN